MFLLIRVFSPILNELNSFFINVSILDQMLIQTENHAILYFDKSKLPLLFIKSPFMEVNNKISRQLLFPELVPISKQHPPLYEYTVCIE